MTRETLIRAGAAGMIISGLALGYSYVSHPHHMTPEMIARARDNAARDGFANVEFRCGMIQDLALDLDLLLEEGRSARA